MAIFTKSSFVLRTSGYTYQAPGSARDGDTNNITANWIQKTTKVVYRVPNIHESRTHLARATQMINERLIQTGIAIKYINPNGLLRESMS